ncbi:MAG: AMIN domain-containing protein [Desulfobacula sp.]|jgi:N-acetylmuramoyl-L-alanine amidase|uniref:N-acetylmuramoyl-L-alanine amidase n=1 Tax=Desulfobacula sp. TaxID=2593537 RepID=UPI001D36F6BF|nr:AMIN domain-containing protein [Desulfobacula sp.]MBT3484965.1 AMIN domain-containing protein [Desulfobacula sp.]MBT3803199.1 AMIN domain-containing protein [Desulfobacula sp.]MBT4024582.1 AMIN domain-containing protein [Desulfobacula sp.]MBT4200280.1 AMIN domain-containing protein [Desulfobacula sp.]
MVTFKKSILQIFLIHFIFAYVFIFTVNGFADSAKQKYMEADACYKKLRHSASKQKKENEWLNCISRYEIIYRLHPKDSWAPAGMYKAAKLYTTLSKLSGKQSHESQAADLLASLQNNYPKSVYAGRAKSMLKTITDNPNFSVKKIRHIRSKKSLSKNNVLIKKFVQSNEVTVKKKNKPEKFGSSYDNVSRDTTITDLRFWSNPEYTRIVINAESERKYSHRLLKKDPYINKPLQRLYIDIEKTKLGKGVAEHTPINDTLLKQARAGQHLPHTVRVVVDIKSFENYKIFSLKDPFRIVIDVWGKGSNGSPASSSPPKVAASEKSGKTSRLSTDNLKSSDIARQFALGVRKIVIDPGHGGSDPGAPGYYKNVWEKDIVLKMAKKLAVTLRQRLKCTVLLTRYKDKKLTLEERTAIANTKKADLFISLHVNAAKNRKLKGIETYILNLATDKQAIAVAARENATSEKNISDLDLILSDLIQNTKIEESTRLANLVQNNFIKGMRKKYSGINNLGVKQAPFYVLLGARMPSILIETSFISNKTECKRLMSDSYQTAIATTITDGIEKYINATNPKQL